MKRCFFYSFIFAAASSTLIGCGSPSVALSDQDAAKALLGSTLEAWKTGKSVADMRQLTPPVYVAEDLWNGDFELHDFTIEGEGEMYGPSVRLNVTLTGSNRGGAVSTQPMQYLVTTTPARTIARTDL